MPLIIFFLMGVLAVTAPFAGAEIWLQPAEGIPNVIDLSAAADGAVYIAQSVPGGILACDHNGSCRNVCRLDFPSAVAGDRAGRLYVGKGRYATLLPPYHIPGEVRIYEVRGDDAGHVASLGSGVGEFVNPTDIYVDLSGKVYVVDSDAHNVKVFSADRSLLMVLGQKGAGDGFFNIPLAVTVDESNGDIYVTDKQLVAGSTSGMVSGARVQVFNSGGEYVRGFGQYRPGELISPSDIALYHGRAYVADSYQNAVIEYDAATGELKNVLQPPDGLLRRPLSLDISGDGMLYVVSSYTGSLYRAGLTDFADLSIQPHTLEFEASSGGPLSPKQEMILKNTGTGVLAWSASADAPWITVDTINGRLDGGTTAVVLVGVDHKNLTEGPYTGRVTVRTAGGTTELLTVGLTVVRPPSLSVTPTELYFEVENGVASAARTISVKLDNAYSRTRWTASASESWITVNPVEAGAETGEARVSVAAGALASGDYRGRVLINSEGAAGSPAEVVVSMRVKETGTIVVMTNCREAAFAIKDAGGRTFEGSGLSWTGTGMPAGPYRIEFHDIPGLLSPAGETQVLAGGGRIQFTGEYRKMPERLVTVDGTSDPVAVRVYDSAGNLLQTFALAGKENSMNDISAGDLDGDGVDEIMAATIVSGNDIGVYSATGLLLERSSAFKGRSRVRLDHGDVDNNGAPEVIMLGRNGKAMKIYRRENGALADTGFGLILDEEAVMASGDLDGDGSAEVVTAIPDEKTSVRIWRILPGQYPWKASLANEVTVGMRPVAIALGDMNDDGIREMVLLDEGGRMLVLDRSGAAREVQLPASRVCDATAGDVDGDGKPDIVVSRTDGLVHTFDRDGTELSRFRVHNGPSSCVRVSAGYVGY
ncbi:MAG: BACON domain-containing protein [Thermodesulfovibrionales bacterium]